MQCGRKGTPRMYGKAGTTILVLCSLLATTACEPPDSGDSGPNGEATSKHFALWAPKTCPAYGDTTVLNIEVSINNWQPRHMTDSAKYANNTQRQWPILFSQNVDQVRYGFVQFSAEDTGDEFAIRHRLGTASYTRYSYGVKPRLPCGNPSA